MNWKDPVAFEQTAAQHENLTGPCPGQVHIDRQVARFKNHVAVLNRHAALGIPVTKVVG